VEPGPLTRRGILAALASSAISLPAQSPDPGHSAALGPLKVCIFSKHLQWADWHEMAEVAKLAGFDGVDLTVRDGGHVLPERVEQDLPKAVEIVHQAGLETPMITAGIVDASSPHADAILRAASGLGIRRYRWGGFKYSYDRPIVAQLEELKPRVRRLAELNEKHNMAAMYHTHSGPHELGAPIWDIWSVLRDLDPRWVGINYDIGHATVEGGFGGWIDSAHLVGRHMLGVAVKDFSWGKDARGEWSPQWCPAGQGMVNFAGFFEILKTTGFNGPVQLHFEYPGMGGAENGKTKLTIPNEQVVAALSRDLKFTKALMRTAGLA
jgi:sugar phosphate isomerase/epimerase